MEKEKLISDAQERYPFLTGITYGSNEYVGIVVNHDNAICTFYDISKMPSIEVKRKFLEYGDMDIFGKYQADLILGEIRLKQWKET